MCFLLQKLLAFKLVYVFLIKKNQKNQEKQYILHAEMTSCSYCVFYLLGYLSYT